MQIIEIRLADDYGVQKTILKRIWAWWSRHRRYYLELRYDFGHPRFQAALGALMFK
jgi:hypothetical protein